MNTTNHNHNKMHASPFDNIIIDKGQVLCNEDYQYDQALAEIKENRIRLGIHRSEKENKLRQRMKRRNQQGG